MQEIFAIINATEPLYLVVLIINTMLLVFSFQIIDMFFHVDVKTKKFKQRLMIFRLLNLIIILALLYKIFYVGHGEEENHLFVQILSILGIVYFAYLVRHVMNYIIVNRYGINRTIQGETRLTETYTTRLLSLFSTTFITIISLITIVRLLGFDSMLEAGGVIGFIGVFLAFTQSTWAPDVFSGLIILNSHILKEGDVIEFDDGGETVYGLVYKTKVFHTEILNIIDNHRMMIRNARLREFTINNLSRFASAKGLREQLNFKIGYDVDVKKVKAMFNEAFEEAISSGLSIEAQHGLEIAISDTGDHAVEWRVFYYTKDVESLPRLRMTLLEYFYVASKLHNISLSTPLTHRVEEHENA